MSMPRITVNGGWTGFKEGNGYDAAGNTATTDLINLLDTLEVPIVVLRRDFTIGCFNRAAADVLGLSPSDIRRASRDVEVLAGLPRLEQQCSQVMTSGVELRLDLRDKGEWFVVRISPYTKDDGQVIGTVLTFTNVTAFRASLDQAVYERECTKAIINTVADPLVVLGAGQRIQTGNRAFYTMFAVSREGVQGLPLYELGNGAFEISTLRNQLEEMLSDGHAFHTLEVDHVLTAKGQRTLILNASPLSFPGHSERRALVTFQDITARKQAQAAKDLRSEEELRRSEAYLAEAQRLSRTGSWHLNVNTGEVLWSQEFFAIFGFDPQETKPSYSLNLERIHPEDRARVEQNREEAIREKKDIELEYRILLPGGEIKYAHSIGHCLVSPSGDIEYIGAVMDITERKRAEEALRKSERKLWQVVDTIPALSWCNLPDGSNEFLNTRWREYTGLEPEESRGWGWQAALHPEDLPLLMEKWRNMLVSGEADEIEARLRRHDGIYRWFLIRAEPLRDEAGTIIRWYGTSTDIDDRKRAEEKLRRSEAFLAEGQQLARIGNFSWRVATDEIIWSEQLYRVFQFEQGTPVTLDLIASRVHPEDIAMLNDMIDQARRGVSRFEYEHRLVMPDTSVKYVHLIAHGSRDNQGQLEYIGAVQDVTRRRSSEEALAKARSEVAQAARVMSLGVLTASIAHEVNQPLSGIVTNASTCLRMLSADPPNVDGALETARRTIRDSNRASDVITRLRALYAKKEAFIEAVDLNDAAREVLALSLSHLQRNRVIVRPEFGRNLPPVRGDRVQLQQVILNLLRNASDAMSTVNDRPRELFIKSERDEHGQVQLSVKDVGVGFDPQSTDKLFDAFFTTKNNGMGIGLSVSRSIVESHHGRLWALLNGGPGATFSFSIPCRSEDSTDVDRVPTPPAKGAV